MAARGVKERYSCSGAKKKRDQLYAVSIVQRDWDTNLKETGSKAGGMRMYKARSIKGKLLRWGRVPNIGKMLFGWAAVLGMSDLADTGGGWTGSKMLAVEKRSEMSARQKGKDRSAKTARGGDQPGGGGGHIEAAGRIISGKEKPTSAGRPVRCGAEKPLTLFASGERKAVKTPSTPTVLLHWGIRGHSASRRSGLTRKGRVWCGKQ